MSAPNTNVIITSTVMPKLEPAFHTSENHHQLIFQPPENHHQPIFRAAPPYDLGVAPSVVKRQRYRADKQEVARVSPAADDGEQYNDQIDDADEEFFNSLPPGYRFCPTDEELIEHYLFKKLKDVELPRNQIREVNIYKLDPDKISERYPSINKNAWYFFTPREKKYMHGSRPNRAAGDGFWKACGADKVIHDKNRPAIKIGLKKALVYHRGKPPKGQKTNWLMHEFMLHKDHPQISEIKADLDRPANSMKLNDFVLCKIYKRNDNALKAADAMEYEGKDQSVEGEDQGDVVKEEFEGNVKAEEYLQNHEPYPPNYDPSIQYPYEDGYFSCFSQMPSTSNYHQNQHHQSGSSLSLNPPVFMNGFDPTFCIDDVDYLVDVFDDTTAPKL